ncbi:MAG: phytanoyl-CoA dioxygenase family protein [Myxococcota bacterium]
MKSREQFLEEVDANGYCVVEDVLSKREVEALRSALENAIEKEVEYHHGREDYVDYAMVMLCSLYGGPFIEVFDNPGLIEPLEWVLGEGCIVYAYTSSSMPPGGTNFSNRIHVDCPRIIPGYETNMGAMVLLDDFTEGNGGSWLLAGSHRSVEPPAQDDFYARAERLIAPAGSVNFLHPRLWHAGGDNQTDRWRHSVTMNMCRPWMKQRIDIPRAMSHMDLSGYSEQARQKLGFLAQVPASYDEYYLPPDQRKFRQPVE